MPDFNETRCSGELMHESGSSGKMFLFCFVFIYYHDICGVAASKGTNDLWIAGKKNQQLN